MGDFIVGTGVIVGLVDSPLMYATIIGRCGDSDYYADVQTTHGRPCREIVNAREIVGTGIMLTPADVRVITPFDNDWQAMPV